MLLTQASVTTTFWNKWKFIKVTENGKEERHLVATVGKFSVIWNFQLVKDSCHSCYQNQEGLKSCYCYKVVLKDDSIVDSRFMHDKYAVSDSPEAPLVVATHLKVSSFSISSRRWWCGNRQQYIVPSAVLEMIELFYFSNFRFCSSRIWKGSNLKQRGTSNCNCTKNLFM